MRLNDRVIREELRKQASSVPIPDDMWAHISRELEKDAAAAQMPAPVPVRPLIAAQRHTRSRSLQLRQILAIGAAAGIFWMMLIPSSAYVDQLKQKDAPPKEPASTSATATTVTQPPTPSSAEKIQWEIPANERHEKDHPPVFKSSGDARRPAPEIAILR